MIPYILAAVGGYLIGDSLKGKNYSDGGMMERRSSIYPLYGKKKDIVEEWQIMTDNEDEVFDNYEDAENFWYDLSDDEKDSGQFFRKVWINGKEDEVEILGGIGYMGSFKRINKGSK